jgi:hypothetical protein
LFNVFFHGLWNALTLSIVVSSLPRLSNNPIYTRLENIAEIAPPMLAGIAVFSVIGLLVANRYLCNHPSAGTANDSTVV